MANADLSDLENAVMEILWKDPAHSVVFKGIEACRAELARIAKMRAWAEGLTREQGRKEYLRWLDYFKREHEQRIAEKEAEARQNNLLPSISRPPTDFR